MIITNQSLDFMFKGFKALYQKGFSNYSPQWPNIAVKTNSGTSEEAYGWLGQFPQLREWVGDRVINNLSTHSFAIKNKKFELTVEVERTKISDDKYGLYAPIFEELGRSCAAHPDDLVFSLLADGFNTPCYDGKNFFDSAHPVGMNGEGSASNIQDGEGAAWFIVDCSRAIKPIIFQEREDYEFESVDRPDDEYVFMRDQFLYGVRNRSNAGFGLWQLAFGSKAPLTAENFEAARAAMSARKGDGGRLLGVKTTHIIVPTSLEGAARRLVSNGTRIVETANGPVAVANEWAGAVDIITSHHLEG